MNIKEQVVEQDYDIKVSFITFFRDLFSNSKGDNEVTQLDRRIREIERDSDIQHIQSLEKEMLPTFKKAKPTKNVRENIQKEKIDNANIEINGTSIPEIEENDLII